MSLSKKMLAVVLSFILAVAPMPAFALDNGSEGADGARGARVLSLGADGGTQSQNDERPSSYGVQSFQAGSLADEPWEAADFTYGTAEKLLYGCDYTRQFSISGPVVSGFSKQGEAKLAAGKTDLVVPSTDPDGNMLIGVGKRAFYEKGLTSVTFPTGMLIPYDDTVTHRVTKRGNFIIFDEAFGKNNLTKVDLPTGVIAVLPSAFKANQLEEVSFGRTIWWIENLAFANNQIHTVNFPITVDFQMEMHGMPFSDNQIKSVRIPDFTAVVNKYSFAMNPGMEETPDENPRKETLRAQGYPLGVVHMYCGDLELFHLDRIHHIEKTTESTKSWYQRLVYVDNGEDVTAWNANDFTYDGNTVTGLSESGIKKRAENKNLVIPDRSPDGTTILHIADSTNTSGGGLFGTREEGFDTVQLPNGLQTIGENAFRDTGLKDVQFPLGLKKIGNYAFMMNQLSAAVLPDTVTSLGSGAFSTNPNLARIGLSKGLTEIPGGAFGCSDQKNWMANLTSITIPDTITKIGENAFAGNNFRKIEIPASVKEIGRFAFSTKNYLKDSCELILHEGLETIGTNAFRNKVIESVDLPTTVKKLEKNTFLKQYSVGDTFEGGLSTDPVLITTVYVSNYDQYTDKVNFPNGENSHVIRYKGEDKWTSEDFTYGEWTIAGDLHPANDTTDKLQGSVHVVTGFTEIGQAKLDGGLTDLVIPAIDTNGNQVCGVGDNAFTNKGITSLTLPAGVKTANDKTSWNASLAQRGNFFIGASAFMGNQLTRLDLPEGVLYVGGSAFKGNKLAKVTFPETCMYVGSQAFAGNQIMTVGFPEKTDFPLQISEMAFAINKLESLQVPTDISFLGANTFLQNTGMEPVVGGNVNQQKGGVVHLYVTDLSKVGTIAKDRTVTGGGSVVQDIKEGTVPAQFAPWGLQHFTFDEAGTTVTGLTDAGKAKLKIDQDLEIPDVGPKGEDITVIGPGETMRGTFGYVESATDFWLPSTVKLPARLKEIGNFAFAGRIVGGGSQTGAGEQYGVTEIDFPDTLTTIGMSAFGLAPLTEVVIPDNVTSVGSGAFSAHDASAVHITSAKLPAGMKDIPMGIFTTQRLDSIVIPEGVETIGRNAFSGNFSTSIILSDTVTAIDRNAFMNCQVTELDIPSSVKTIGQSAFRVSNETSAATLAKLTLHEGLESIGKQAFGKSALDSVELPTTLTTLDKDAFEGNDGGKVILRTAVADQANATGAYAGIVVEGSGHKVVYDKLANSGWSMDDFTYDETRGAITGWTEKGRQTRLTNHDLVLPDTTPGGKPITIIGESAFRSPDSEVSFDDSKYDYNDVQVIKEGKPMPGRWLQSVVFPKDLVEIEKDAFLYNYLTAVPFDSAPNLTTIGETAFKGNRIRSIHLPEKAVDLRDGAFAANYLVDLKLPNTLKKIPAGCFSMNIRLAELTIPTSVTEIGEMAFAGARFEELIIPSSVKKIGRKAFHLHHLTELTIPGSVKDISSEAFEGTFKAQTLKKLNLEEGIETIGHRAFKEGHLTEVALPKSLKAINGEPFLNNDGNEGLIPGKSHVVKLTTDNPEHLKFNSVVDPLTGETRTPENHWVVMNPYTITFDANGGSASPKSAKTGDDGTLATGTLSGGKLPTATKVKGDFLGWYTAKTGGTKVTEKMLFTKNTTVYAHWNNYYNVKFVEEKNGIQIQLKNDKVYEGKTAVAPANPKRTGYTFDGWDKAFTNVKSDLTVKAKFKPITYKIAYTLDGGKVSSNPTSYTIETATITLKNPTRTGYTFAGWTGSNGTKAQTSVRIAKGSTGNKTYKANWAANKYTVKFNGNGSTGGTMKDQTVTYGAKPALSANAFKRTGYTFAGWNTKKDGKGTAYKDKAAFAVPAANTTLYAQWKISKYTVTFKDGVSAKALKTQSVEYGKAATAPKAPTRAGYVFSGWDKAFGKVTSNLTVTAKWKGDVAKATVTGIVGKIYNGKAQAQTKLTVKLDGKALKYGTDYTIAYKDNVKAGTATFTISGKGNYTGSVSKTFRIVGWTRLWGQGSLDTMAEISKAWGSAKTAVVATNADFKDTLAAIGLAGSLNCPVLVTSPKGLSAQTRGELARMGVKTVYVMGGTGGVTTAVEEAIKALPSKPAVKRVSGKDAASKSVAAAKAMPSRSKTVVITRPLSFGDALSISPYAYATKSPVIYTDPSTGGGTPQYKLSAEAVDYIKSAGFTHAVVVGGIYAVPDSVLSQLASAGIPAANVTRLAGNGAYETSRVIGEWATGRLKNGTGGNGKGSGFYKWASIKFQPAVKLSANDVGISRGDDWKDALCGSALCGKKKSILLLASKENQANAVVVGANKGSVTHGYVFGGSVAVPEKVVKPFRDAAL